MSSNYAPDYTAAAPVMYDPEVKAAILRMSRHIAWMFWLWIGIPLGLGGIAVVLVGLALTGGSGE
jgi:hypothetical protein